MLIKHGQWCYDAALTSKANRTVFWQMDDRTLYHTGVLNSAYKDSDSHVMAVLYDPRGYEQRMVTWFRETLATAPVMANYTWHKRQLRDLLAAHPLPSNHRFLSEPAFDFSSLEATEY